MRPCPICVWLVPSRHIHRIVVIIVGDVAVLFFGRGWMNGEGAFDAAVEPVNMFMLAPLQLRRGGSQAGTQHGTE